MSAKKPKKVSMGDFMQQKVDLFSAGFEDAFKLQETMPCEARGEDLNRLAEQVTGITRKQGEGDNSFRRRVSQRLTLDEDARFADKVEAAIKDFDAEEREEEL